MSQNQQENPDRFLVRQLLSQNEKAFRNLYEKYRGAIYAYSRNLLKSDVAAEEIVQEVFLKVWMNSGNLKPDLCFKAYVFTIARNLCFNNLHRAANNQLLREEIFYKSQASGNSTYDAVLDADYESVRSEAVNQLPPKRRLIFEMSRTEGKTHEEISQELGISINTVKSQMTKALESIRQYLVVHTDLTFLIVFLLTL